MRQETFHNLFALDIPFATILQGIRQGFLVRYAKDTTLVELLRQGNNVIVKEPELSTKPSLGGILAEVTIHPGNVALFERVGIELLVGMAMLHGVRSLDNVLENDGGLSIQCGQVAFLATPSPSLSAKAATLFTQLIEILDGNDGGHDRIDDQVTEMRKFVIRGVDAKA